MFFSPEVLAAGEAARDAQNICYDSYADSEYVMENRTDRRVGAVIKGTFAIPAAPAGPPVRSAYDCPA